MSNNNNERQTWIVESNLKNTNPITPGLPALKNLMTI